MSADPLSRYRTIPFSFDRAKDPDEQGPVGERFVPFPSESTRRVQVPNLGVMRRMNARFTTLSFQSLGSGFPQWNPIDLSRPSLLVPCDPLPAPPALVSNCIVTWWPETPGAELLEGLPCIDGVIHAPSPGRIYVAGTTGQTTPWRVPYAILSAEDTGLVKLFLEGRWNSGWGSSGDVVLAAGVAQEIATLDTMFLASGVILSNVGANPARYAIGTPAGGMAATTGILLPANSTTYLERPYFSNAGVLTARSTAGTTLSLAVMRRGTGLG